MNEAASIVPIAAEELLARFVLFSGWIRRSDQTVKQDAFIPFPHRELSITRHLGLSERELWMTGQATAQARPATLYGRADLTAIQVRNQKLDVESKPLSGNPKHANIVGWPADKPAQKSFPQELASVARFVPNPGLRLE